MWSKYEISEYMRYLSKKGRDAATEGRKKIPPEKRREIALKAVAAREKKRKARKDGQK